eukprot:scaffold174098_cov31-Tisochrysis_lutea.AAC.3
MACLLDILVDKLREALDERVGKPLLDGLCPPLSSALDVATVGRIIKDNLLAIVAHRLRDVLVDGHGSSIDNAHVHAVLDGVVKEHCVHGLTKRGEATETEGEVGDAAGDVRAGQVFPDVLGGHDEVLGVIVVLFKAGGDCEDVRVKDDVMGRKTDLGADEDVVGALADAALVLEVGGLANFVEGHDDHGGAVALDGFCFLDEILLALLERD